MIINANYKIEMHYNSHAVNCREDGHWLANFGGTVGYGNLGRRYGIQ